MAVVARISKGLEPLRRADGPAGYLVAGASVIGSALVTALLVGATLLYVLFWLNVARLHVLDGAIGSAGASVAVALGPPVILFVLVR